jgi:DNA replication and repair protein RecF
VHVRWLEVVAFRNHASLSFAPDRGLNVLSGRNGHGKTSLLEAVHLLLTGRSFRTAHAAECVAWGAAEAVVTGEVEHGPQSRTVRVTVAAHAGVSLGAGLCPWARVVTFTAADLALVGGPPLVRRAYLDGAATKLWPAHAEVCRRYRLVLYQRARLLGRLAGRADGDGLLAPWDEQAARLGSEIMHRRIETLAALAPDVRAAWRALAADEQDLELGYVPQTEPGPGREETRGRLLERLQARRRAEMARGVTLVGPHRDDLAIRLGGMDARSYASRGGQRTITVTLRLAEAAATRRRQATPPVLLLDDGLSELDAGARGRLLGWLGEAGQVLLSTTDGVPLDSGSGMMWAVEPGAVAAQTADAVVMAGGVQ